LARRATTTNSTTELTTTGAAPAASTRLIIPSGRAWTYHILLTAYQYGGTAGSTGDSAGFEIKGVVKNVGGTTSEVGGGESVTSWSDAAANGWTATIAADDTNDCLVINVTGETDKNIHWVASIMFAEAG